MRVAVVVNSFPSLSETFLFNMVMGLRAAGVDLSVLAHEGRNDLSLFAARLGKGGAEFVSYAPLAGGTSGLPGALAALSSRSPARAHALWRRVRSRYGRGRRAWRMWAQALPLYVPEYDVIHFAYSGIAVAYLDALPLLGPARLLTSCRGSAERITPLVQPDRAARLRDIFALLDRVHCVSADMRETVQGYGLPPEKAFVNHPAIDAGQFRRESSHPDRTRGPYRLLSTGRLHWCKGLEYALLAVRRLVREGYDARYEILGSGPEEEKLRFAIHDLGLSAHVHLRGGVSAETVREALESADVYLLPSVSEGISNAALEAMAMEVPVVSSAVGGMPEAITDGRDGFLVPPRDPAALAAKTGALLDAPELRLRVGKAARRRVEEAFTLERQIACFVREYDLLLDRAAPPAEVPKLLPA